MNSQNPKTTSHPFAGKIARLFCVLLAAALLFSATTPAAFAAQAKKPTKGYGVFVGLEREDISRLYDYKRVVIDAQGFKKSDIQKLHKKGVLVYSYLNIGSLEEFRSYYETYKKHALDRYENWPDEYWMDVSQKEWQDHIVENLAGDLVEKKVDGFFLDNADVYYQYPKKKIYNGLVKILRGLRGYRKNILINGGDPFVTKLLKTEKTPEKLISGVNQECVLTRIDFENECFKKQKSSETEYFAEYLKECKKAGLRVHLTEYTPGDKKLEARIRSFAKRNGHLVYISPGLQLDGTKGF